MAREGLARGAAVMASCNGVKILLQLALTPTLARLLGPGTFGLYSLALPSVIFVMMLADGGLGQSLAREPEDHAQVWSSAFWLVLGLGVVLALALTAWSLPLSHIAHQPRLPQVMAPLSLCVILLALTVLPSARLTRRRQLGSASLIDLAGNATGAAVAVGLALTGAGVWSLVGQFLTVFGVRAVGANLLAFRRPSLTFNWRIVAPHTLLGGAIVVTKLVDSLGRMLETTLVSRRFGAADLGMYAFSNQAAWSLVQAANNPAGSMLYAHALDAPPAEIKALYRRVVRVTALVTLPATAIIAGAAPLLTSVLLGKAWLAGALLIAMVFPSQALATLGQLPSAVLYAGGRSLGQLWLALINSALRLGAVLIPFGQWTAVAVYIAVANLAYFALGLINARIQLGWSLGETFSVIRGPLLAAGAAGLCAWLLTERVSAGPLQMLAVLAAGGGAYAVVLCLIDSKPLRRDLQDLMAMAARRAPRVVQA